MAQSPTSAVHRLMIDLDPEASTLTGKDVISVTQPGCESVTLFLNPKAVIRSVTAKDATIGYTFTDGQLTARMKQSGDVCQMVLTVEYSCVFDDPVPEKPVSFDNPGFGVEASIGPKGAVLLGGSGWLPTARAEREVVHLTTSMPEPFKTVTAGKLISCRTENGRNLCRWTFSMRRPPSLVAGPYQVSTRDTPYGKAMTYFSAQNQDLSDTYLTHVAEYLKEFSELHGPYAFSKFAVVENFYPTGFGMPSFTLLGARVLRLPFIPATSLRHEVAHCWWGNGVLVDYMQGNWCEGLTAYVADYLAKERSSLEEARDYRRQVLRDYAILAAGSDDLPLATFISRTSPATQAVGYGKAMFVFHMLRRRAGDRVFWNVLRALYSERLFSPTNWGHFQEAFARKGGMDAVAASAFFRQWINRTGAPELGVDSVEVAKDAGGYTVTGVLKQTGDVYDLKVPVRVETVQGSAEAVVHCSGRETRFSVPCPYKPVRLEVDPDSHVFRLLSPGEIPATVNSVKGAKGLTAVVGKGVSPRQAELLPLLLASLNQRSVAIVREQNADFAALAGEAVLFFGRPATEAGKQALGLENGPASLPGIPADAAGVLKSSEAVFAVVSGQTPERFKALFDFKGALQPSAVENYARKITHYGKYGYLGFSKGRNVIKGVPRPAGTPLSVSLD